MQVLWSSTSTPISLWTIVKVSHYKQPYALFHLDDSCPPTSVDPGNLVQAQGMLVCRKVQCLARSFSVFYQMESVLYCHDYSSADDIQLHLSLITLLSCLGAVTDHHVWLSLFSKIKRFLILKIHTTAKSTMPFSHSHRFAQVHIRKNVVHLSQCATQLILQPAWIYILRLDCCRSLLAGPPPRSRTTLRMIQNKWKRFWFLSILKASMCHPTTAQD